MSRFLKVIPQFKISYDFRLFPQRDVRVFSERVNIFYASSGYRTSIFSLLPYHVMGWGARGSLVVKAIGYKPEGRGFETQ
jgi:hypothetical protein